MSFDQIVVIFLGVATAVLVVPLVLAVGLDRRGKGERVPRQGKRLASWVLGVGLVALGVLFYWWSSQEPAMEWPSAWAWCMPLTAIFILAVVRPRWAARELVIMTVVVAVAISYPVVVLFAPPALVAAALLRASIPGFSLAKFLSPLSRAPIAGPLPRA